MTWKNLLQHGEDVLRDAGIMDIEIDAWYLLEHVSAMSRANFFMKQDEIVPLEQQEYFQTLIEKRAQHIPLQHLTGSQEFMGLEFQVSPHVLIPRQDTELLVENLLPLISGKKVLDMCTGSGCIAISLAKLGNPLSVDAADLSKEALDLAQKNADQLQVKVQFLQSDMFQNITASYDVIVSNPPYIVSDVIHTLMPEVKEHEPMMALDGGEDGLLFYRQIVKEALNHLYSKGMVWMEIGYDQRESVTRLLAENGFCEIECLKDLCGLDRVVKGIRP